MNQRFGVSVCDGGLPGYEFLWSIRAAGNIGALAMNGLGDVPVLAEGAVEVAARETNRRYFRTRPKVVERLFFDRVNGKGSDKTIKRYFRFSVTVKPDPAASAIARSQKATPMAELAL